MFPLNTEVKVVNCDGCNATGYIVGYGVAKGYFSTKDGEWLYLVHLDNKYRTFLPNCGLHISSICVHPDNLIAIKGRLL